MESRSGRLAWLPHLILVLGLALVGFPIYVTFVGSTMTTPEILSGHMSLVPGGHFVENYLAALTQGMPQLSGVPVARLLLNSLVMALAIALGKMLISFLSAYAIVFFRFPGRMVFFWMIFLTLMLPVEVRIVPTFQVTADLGLIDSYGGMVIPLIASATATLLFRQFFLTVPDELIEAARLDGAGPLRFLWDVLLPLSRTNLAALFVILFVYGWNQYLWPLLVTNTASMTTLVVGIKSMLTVDADTPWHLVMAMALLAMVPPAAVVLLMQRWFVKGLVDAEK
jgi:sn-glycerol 3-phosphate transport system permease protein